LLLVITTRQAGLAGHYGKKDRLLLNIGDLFLLLAVKTASNFSKL
jgi:hypothetical protein